ncbi:MAG TPA: DUF455 domain-containing protein, partial [Nitrospiria bacterium]|nr:DUF455 domain-containing protein [Nitrospiria bacterium]
TGTRWFRCFAEAAGEDPDCLFTEILQRFYSRNGRGRFVANLEARRLAGFSEMELSCLNFPPTPGP